MSTAKFPEQYIEKVTLDGNDFILVSDSADADELKKVKKAILEAQLNINYSNINRGLILVNPTRDNVESAAAQGTWYEWFRFTVNCEDDNMVLDLNSSFNFGLTPSFSGDVQRFRFGLQRSDTAFAGSTTGAVLDLGTGDPDSNFNMGVGIPNEFTVGKLPGSSIGFTQNNVELVDPDTGTAGLKYYRVCVRIGLTPVTNIDMRAARSFIKIYKSKG